VAARVEGVARAAQGPDRGAGLLFFSIILLFFARRAKFIYCDAAPSNAQRATFVDPFATEGDPAFIL